MNMYMSAQSKKVTQSGQMLLITILVLTIATTIGLSLIGRSTLDVSMTNQLEDSSRAFSAAEAGVEQALHTGLGTGSPQVLTAGSGITYDVSVGVVGGATGVYQIARKTPRGVTETLWLVNHNDDGTIDETSSYRTNTLNLCWSQELVVPALVGTVLYKEGVDSTYKVVKFAYDPDAASRANNFTSSVSDVNGCGLGNYYQVSVDFSALGISLSGVNQDTLLELRLRPEYADTTIAVDSGLTALPKQGKLIQSVGKAASGVTRKVVVYQQYRTAGSIFDNVIFSQSSFGHN